MINLCIDVQRMIVVLGQFGPIFSATGFEVNALFLQHYMYVHNNIV